MAAAEQTNLSEEQPPCEVDLNGEFRFKVDAKGRLALPAKFRKVLPSDLVVTRDPHDECLYVFTTPAFNQWIVSAFENKFGGFDNTNGAHVKLRRKLKSRASDVSVDASGRIMLSAEQRKSAGIDRDAVLVGNTGYFEIWDAKRYDAINDETDLGALFD